MSKPRTASSTCERASSSRPPLRRRLTALPVDGACRRPARPPPRACLPSTRRRAGRASARHDPQEPTRGELEARAAGWRCRRLWRRRGGAGTLDEGHAPRSATSRTSSDPSPRPRLSRRRGPARRALPPRSGRAGATPLPVAKLAFRGLPCDSCHGPSSWPVSRSPSQPPPRSPRARHTRSPRSAPSSTTTWARWLGARTSPTSRSRRPQAF